MQEPIQNGQMPPIALIPPSPPSNSDFEIDSFLLTALNNPRDRLVILKLDQELEKFLQNPSPQLQFPPMSSYQRLIVHRVAEYFKLAHVVINVEPGKKAVLLSKTLESQMPILRFSDLIEKPPPPTTTSKQVSLLRRNANGETKKEYPKERKSASTSSLNSKDRTLEEREEEYARARARIFGVENGKQDENVSGSLATDSVPKVLPPQDVSTVEHQEKSPKSVEKINGNSKKIDPEFSRRTPQPPIPSADSWNAWNSDGQLPNSGSSAYANYYESGIVSESMYFGNYSHGYSQPAIWSDSRWYHSSPLIYNYAAPNSRSQPEAPVSNSPTFQSPKPIPAHPQQHKSLFEPHGEQASHVPNQAHSQLPSQNQPAFYTDWSFGYPSSAMGYPSYSSEPYYPNYDLNGYQRRPPPKSTELYDPNAPTKPPRTPPPYLFDKETNHFPRSPSHDSFFSVSSNSRNGSQQERDPQVLISEFSQLIVDQGDSQPAQLNHILQIFSPTDTELSPGQPELEEFLNLVRSSGATIKWIDRKTPIAIYQTAESAQKALSGLAHGAHSLYLSPWKIPMSNNSTH